MNLFQYTYNLVRQIPFGKLSTYGAIACALGDRIASRAVGYMMHQNPDPDTMPCFKIVHADGRLGGFGRGMPDKIRRLTAEGISVAKGRIVDFNHVFFDDFKTEYPLQQCQAAQRKLAQRVVLDDDFSEISTVAGIDVAYPQQAFDVACGAYVLMEYPTAEILETATVFQQTFFPYIPSYLAYRELPVIEALLKKIKTKPSVFLFDGNGVVHPRGCGLASHVGVLFNVPSVGVAKKRYSFDIEKNEVTLERRPACTELVLSAQASKPVIVSPGHRVSLSTCVSLVKQLSTYNYPEPLRQAHILAKKMLLMQQR
ncbi:MAG: endonuclease V [Candidatus Thermoplasmatota archaeon]